jgi:hypothetical protein
MNIEYVLGLYIGEIIFLKYLPALDVDSLQTKNVIETSVEERETFKKLHDDWFLKYFFDKKTESEKWKKYRTYAHYLEKKYMPHRLECYVSKFEVENESVLKKGIQDYLWDCDVCSYKIEKIEYIEIIQEEYSTKVILSLDLDKKI